MTKRTSANRRNSKKSTGPTNTSSTRFNAAKHGLLSVGITELDDADEYGTILRDLTKEKDPRGPVEASYVESAALDMVRLRRARRLEAEFITAVAESAYSRSWCSRKSRPAGRGHSRRPRYSSYDALRRSPATGKHVSALRNRDRPQACPDPPRTRAGTTHEKGRPRTSTRRRRRHDYFPHRSERINPLRRMWFLEGSLSNRPQTQDDSATGVATEEDEAAAPAAEPPGGRLRGGLALETSGVRAADCLGRWCGPRWKESLCVLQRADYDASATLGEKSSPKQ